jgi:hypothetical protein
MAIEKAMVSANWRKRIPVVPGKKCDRHEDGDQHQRGGDDGAGDFLHGVGGGFGGAGLALLQVALDVFNHDNHVVDDQPGRQRDAEKRERVDGEAEQLDESERADERNWSGDEVNDRGSPVAEENEDHQDDQQIAEPTVRSTSRMDSPTASVVSKAISYFMPGGKRLDRRSSSATHFGERRARWRWKAG